LAVAEYFLKSPTMQFGTMILRISHLIGNIDYYQVIHKSCRGGLHRIQRVLHC